MKKISFFLLCSLLSTAIFAQSDKFFNFGLGATFSLPTADLSEATSYGVGFEAKAKFNISESFEAFASTGINVFKGKDIGFGYTAPNFMQIPIIAGADFKLNHIILGGGIGYGLWSASGGGGSSNGFMYMPHAGYASDKYEILANYNSTLVDGGSLSYFGIKFFRYF